MATKQEKMNYKESEEILEEINNSNRIAINLHRSPDPDSFASAFALYYFVKSLNKSVDVLLTNKSELSGYLLNLKESSLINFVNYSEINFNKYDLFISPDSAAWQQVVDDVNVSVPEMDIIVIDHHESNEKFGKINLVDKTAVSCAQIVYLLLHDWGFLIGQDLANLLMTGIVADSGGFAFSNDVKVFEVASRLIELGANKMEIVKEIFRTRKFEELKAWGQYLVRMELDIEHKFVWTAMSYKDYVDLNIPTGTSSMVSTQFGSMVEGTDFGIVMTEDSENNLKIGFRSRGDCDVSKLAARLNGGGHKMASGGMIENLTFEDAVEKVLSVAREFAKENAS